MKTLQHILSLGLCLAAASLLGVESKEQADRRKLAGVWKGFVVEGRGENPDRGPVKLELRVTEQEMAGLEFRGTNLVDHGKGTYALDLTQTPPRLDATQTNARGRPQTYLGIYSLEGETLKWCVSPRKSRPAEFRSQDGGFLLILKRQKP